jgi:hypothetical protein
MNDPRFRRRLVLAAGVVLCAAGLGSAAADTSDRGSKNSKDSDRPNLSLRATPAVSFSPARIFLTGELRGGADDYQDFYCTAVEWDWGDGTRSESSYDCDPYEAGKSEIRRRFATEHVYRTAGNYRIQIRLKRDNKSLVSASTNVQVRPGFRDPSNRPF